MLKHDNFSVGSMIRLTWYENDWVLIDGQHRLFAISELGMAAPMTALFCHEPISEEYAKCDSVGELRSKRQSAISYGMRYTEIFSGRTLDRFLAACGIIESNFQSNSKLVDKLNNAKFADTFTDEMALLVEWGKGSGVFSQHHGGSMKAPIIAVALVTTKYAPRAIAKDFWLNAFHNDGLKKLDPRRRMNEEITKSTAGGGSGTRDLMKKTAYIWNWYVLQRGRELTRIEIPDKMPHIELTEYPLKDEKE